MTVSRLVRSRFYTAISRIRLVNVVNVANITGHARFGARRKFQVQDIPKPAVRTLRSSFAQAICKHIHHRAPAMSWAVGTVGIYR